MTDSIPTSFADEPDYEPDYEVLGKDSGRREVDLPGFGPGGLLVIGKKTVSSFPPPASLTTHLLDHSLLDLLE